MPREITYDERSYDLASYFLAGSKAATEADRVWLARCIQKTIEEWLADHEDRLEAKDADAK